MPKRILPALCLCALFCAGRTGAQDLFSPVRPLYSIATEHFTIIFPTEARPAAERLASFAEEEYADIAGRLDQPLKLRLPVVITPDSQTLNGGYTFMTPAIYLYQAPISPANGFASYQDDLRKLFRHELTHAVSMMTRNGFFDFLAFLFCDGLSPTWAAPNSFIEGVTVSFESDDGFGRAAQTGYASAIQQDIIEGKFKDFPQAAGSWSGWPFGIWYVYGGYFSRYLQESYGMEAYAGWWERLSQMEGFHSYGPFKGSFEKAFGLPVERAWADFAAWMAIKKPVVTTVEPLEDKLRAVRAITAGAGKLFWADESAVWEWDPATRSSLRLFSSDYDVNRLSLSPDGRELLVSWARTVDGLARLVLRVWDLAESRWVDQPLYAQLQEAAWLADGSGFVASRIDGYEIDLVEVRGGQTRILFKGTESLVPGNPCPLPDGSVAFLLRVEGVASVAKLDVDGSLSVLESDAFSIPHASRTIMSNIRNLSASDGELSFAWDSDLSLHKLARLGPEGLSVQTTSLSGGIQYPVALDGSLYYAGSFSDGQRLCRYPSSNPYLRLEAVESSWRPLSPELLAQPSVYDAPPSMDARPWSPFPRLLLPQVRLPRLAANLFVAPDHPAYLAGAGMHGESIDPTQANVLLWDALYRWNEGFVDASMTYAFQGWPVAIQLGASDRYLPASLDGSLMARQTMFNLGFNQTISFMPASRSLSWDLQGALAFISTGTASLGVAQASPYGWAYSQKALALGGSLGYANMAGSPFQPQGLRGWALSGDFSSWLPELAPTPPPSILGLRLSGALPFMNLRADIRADWAPIAGASVGPAGALLDDGSPFPLARSPAWTAYAQDGGLNSPWYLFGNLQAGWRFRTDQSFKWLGVYVKDLALFGGYRAGLAAQGAAYLHSAWLRASAAIGLYSVGALQSAFADIGVEVDLRLTDGAPVISPYLSIGM